MVLVCCGKTEWYATHHLLPACGVEPALVGIKNGEGNGLWIIACSVNDQIKVLSAVGIDTVEFFVPKSFTVHPLFHLIGDIGHAPPTFT